ncbi:hypothetical protein A5784_25790 [Mycobacterium sp. 852013-50091_SCH5140682]|uniref:hypothetical protein n=1 Tax=Mycobacterium sp. 852013-50091_SCH5140682 TaxID=1834109 RepID=UPI0007EA0151|nr:hypothetical protein [Mycobacterium sp. 852013-50091_SCH5140682]OBC16631.1 hypothetical protein A5784_25790 [Mycobacterium sp. 852013-50091_SCH5140682]
MGMPPDSSPYGSQTVTGPGWPNIDEEQLTAASASYQKLAANITGNIVPQQTNQLMKLNEVWQGTGATAASGEATTMIGHHESNGAQAEAIATQLTTMAAAVVQTKTAVNATAQQVQQEVEMLQALPIDNKQALIEGVIKMGLSQNIATVTAATSELASSLGTTANMPAVTTPPTAEAQQAAQKGGEQMMQMLGQLPQMLGQIPQMLGQVPQQLTQPLQQLTQPLQQLTQMFGSAGKGGTGGGPMPFSAFSTHPAAGGSGPSSGAGLMKAASLPGSGGGGAQTPLMGKLVGGPSPVSVATEPAMAGSNAFGGVAPVSAGGMGGGMGPMGAMGHRGSGGGGTTQGLAVPAPLEHELDDGDVDDDW